MSIKIYEGRRVKIAPDLIKLKKFSKAVGEVLNKHRLKLYNEMFPTLETRQDAKNKYWSSQPFRDLFDFGAELCYFGLDEKTTLMIPFLGRRDYSSILDLIPEIEDYGYWTSSDKPEEVSRKEWRQRRKDWDKVLLGDKDGIPGEEGFTIRVLPAGLPGVLELLELGLG